MDETVVERASLAFLIHDFHLNDSQVAAIGTHSSVWVLHERELNVVGSSCRGVHRL